MARQCFQPFPRIPADPGEVGGSEYYRFQFSPENGPPTQLSLWVVVPTL
jgi:hypothetical protein